MRIGYSVPDFSPVSPAMSFPWRHPGGVASVLNSVIVQWSSPHFPTRLCLTVYTGHRYLGRVSLQEPSFFILTALARAPLHGYGVMRAVSELSQGRLELRAGTLYAALDRLTEDGLLEVDREEAVEGRLRRYYRLTEPGAARLEAEIAQLRANVATAAAQLRRRPGAGVARPAATA